MSNESKPSRRATLIGALTTAVSGMFSSEATGQIRDNPFPYVFLNESKSEIRPTETEIEVITKWINEDLNPNPVYQRRLSGLLGTDPKIIAQGDKAREKGKHRFDNSQRQDFKMGEPKSLNNRLAATGSKIKFVENHIKMGIVPNTLRENEAIITLTSSDGKKLEVILGGNYSDPEVYPRE